MENKNTLIETKEQLINHIKDWIQIDNDIKVLQFEINRLKNDKKKKNIELMETMKKNEIDCFNLKEGTILYKIKNTKKPITKKYMVELLTKYYEGNTEKVNDLITYMNDNREKINKEEIVRKINK